MMMTEQEQQEQQAYLQDMDEQTRRAAQRLLELYPDVQTVVARGIWRAAPWYMKLWWTITGRKP